jgi:5-methylcytosine-specific restriction endonuclease McrA
MSITDKTRKKIWGRSGNRCANCKRELVMDATELDDEAVVGDECHIVAQEPGGPRYDPGFPAELVDNYDNLILLCKACHKLVDDQPKTYTVEYLRNLKQQHIEYVRTATEPLSKVGVSNNTPQRPVGPDTIEKEIGVLWSHRADIPEETVLYRFRGQLLAQVRTEDANGPTWYELYHLQNGRYVVYAASVHRMDYSEAYLHGVNAGGEVDPPLTLERLQEEFPILATRAGLSQVIDFDTG